MNCFMCIFAPCKYTMVFAENCRNCNIIFLLSFKLICNQNSCVLLISFLDLFFCQIPYTWDFSVNVICMCCSITRNISSCLCPACCPCGMCMYNTTDFREAIIKNNMCRCIGRWIITSLYFISIQVNNNHILRSQLVIFNSAWFNNKQSALSVDSTYISPCKCNQIVFWKQHICLIHFFF